MARGGRRIGAERKPGSLEKRNRLIAETTPTTHENLRRLSPLDEKVITQLTLVKRAAEIAKDTAPYRHAKQATAREPNWINGKPITHHITVEIVDAAALIP